MAALDQLNAQLDSFEELRSIVKTMKALSAASIRQYERAAGALDSYFMTVELGLQILVKDMPQPVVTTRKDAQPRRFAAIVFGSDHGLCGHFNEEIARHALAGIESMGADTGQCLILAVGERVADSLERENLVIDSTFQTPGSAAQITVAVQRILLKIEAWVDVKQVDTLQLFYNSHQGGSSYHPEPLELLPLNVQRFDYLRQKPWSGHSLPTFSMERDDLLHHLLRQYLLVSIFRACAKSQASEHASRLAAMQSAQQHLDERLDEVTMAFRRARQSHITAELLDVVSGFEAIMSKPTNH